MRAPKADIAGLPDIDAPWPATRPGRARPTRRARTLAADAKTVLGPAGLPDDDIRAAMADISEQGSGHLGGCLDWLAPRDPRVGPR